MELIDLYTGLQKRIRAEFDNVNNWSKYDEDQLILGMYVKTEHEMDPFIADCDYLIGRELAYMGRGVHHSGCFRANYAVVEYRDVGLFITLSEIKSGFGVSLKRFVQIRDSKSVKSHGYVHISNLDDLERAVGDLLRAYPVASLIERLRNTRELDMINAERAASGVDAFAFLDS